MPTPNLVVRNPIDKYFEKPTRYHYYFFTFYIISKLTNVWHTLNIIFISPDMEYHCGTARNASVRVNGTPGSRTFDNKCPCDDPVWDLSIFTKTVQTKFRIICDDKWLISLSESMTFVGLLVGAFTFGVLSDRYGRLNTFTVCQIIMGVAGCFVALMPTIFLFIVMRFFEGVGCGGGIVTGFVFCMEYCGSKYRAIVSSLIHIPANFGLILLAGLSYMIRDCDKFQLAVSIPMFFFVTAQCLLLESPKWLLDNDKEKVIKVMMKFCRFNKDPCESLRTDIESYHGSQMNLSSGKKLKFYHIFKYKNHTQNFFCMAYCFLVCGMCYYGVAQFIGKMSTHVHLNTVFNGLFCCLGTIFCILLINRLGRKLFLRATMSLAGISMFIVVLIPLRFQNSLVKVICACCSCSLFYMSLIIVFLYGVELFPTSIRNSVFGMLSLSSRIGQIMGPQINALSNTVAGSIFAIAAIIAAGLTFLLPETKGTELPSTLEKSPTLRLSHVKFSSAPSRAEPETAQQQPNVSNSPHPNADLLEKTSRK